MKNTSAISVACFNQDVWIRVEGCGSFECSTGLREYAKMMIEQGYLNYIIDLKNCHQMDSTFMGTITGIAQYLSKNCGGALQVVNVSEHNKELMEGLGLDQLFSIYPLILGHKTPSSNNDHPFFTTPSLLAKNAKAASRDTLLSAHKALVLANNANAEKFRNIFDYIH